MKNRALFVKFLYKVNDSVLAVLQKFLSIKGIKKSFGVMSAKILKKVIKEIEGYFEVKSGRGR